MKLGTDFLAEPGMKNNIKRKLQDDDDNSSCFGRSMYHHHQPVANLKREENGSSLLDDDDDDDTMSCLPRTVADTNDFVLASPYSVSSPADGNNKAARTSTTAKSKSGGSKKLSKDSEEYKRRRYLNNIAVKKSREKAKEESKKVAQRVSVLMADNERLEKRVDQLTKEIQFLHGLFSKYNDVPEGLKIAISQAYARMQAFQR